LYLARENLDRAVLLMNGDVIYDTQLLSGLIEDPFPNVLLVEFDRSLQDGEMNVRTQDGLVVEIGKHILAAAADGESAQIVKFGRQSAALLKSEVEHWIRDRQVHAFPSELYHVIISQAGLSAMKTGGVPWFEIDTQEDYLHLCSYYGYGQASACGTL
jgi:choline kinase